MLLTIVTLVSIVLWAAMIYMATDMYLGFRRIHSRHVGDTSGDTRIP